MEVMRRLQHRHIVRLYDAAQAQGMLFMAIELAEGGSLEQRLRSGPLDLLTTARVLAQVAAALDHAHRQGVVHRDVKPNNILFTRDGRVLLSDFGIASVAGASRLTQSGAKVGTPAYFSPEQALGLSQPDPRSDVYALGVVAYQLLAGRLPFERDNPLAILLAHLDEPPPPLPASVPQPVQMAVMRALAKSPEQRFTSAGAFAQAVAAGVGARVGSTTTTQGRVRIPRSWAIAGALGIVITVLLALVLALPREGGNEANPTTRANSNLPPAAGSLLAFESDQDGDKEIYVADASGRGRWRLTEDSGQDRAPNWSPDGKSLVFVSDRTGFTDIFTMDRFGRNLVNLTQSTAEDSGPAWSPNGQRIAFDSNREGNLDIFVMNVDGRGLTNLTRYPSFDGDPSWSPDGQWIVFESDRDGNFEIYVAPSKGGPAKALTISSAREFAPVWSPNDAIVFECHRDGDEICVMNADGSGLRRLTTDDVADKQPSWSQDGRQIVWSREQRVGKWESICHGRRWPKSASTFVRRWLHDGACLDAVVSACPRKSPGVRSRGRSLHLLLFLPEIVVGEGNEQKSQEEAAITSIRSRHRRGCVCAHDIRLAHGASLARGCSAYTRHSRHKGRSRHHRHCPGARCIRQHGRLLARRRQDRFGQAVSHRPRNDDGARKPDR